MAKWRDGSAPSLGSIQKGKTQPGSVEVEMGVKTSLLQVRSIWNSAVVSYSRHVGHRLLWNLSEEGMSFPFIFRAQREASLTFCDKTLEFF